MNATDLKKPASVLIVDDEAGNVKLLETILHSEGYSTLTASNGNEAITLAQSARPDLILLDVMMPGMDGFETVTRLKADPRTKSVPVIIITALDGRDSKLHALTAGAEEFLSKPIDRASLTVRVRNLLRLKEYSDLLVNHNHLLDEQVKQRTAQLEEAYRDTVHTLVRAAEQKDEETGQHIRRISFYCKLLAGGMGLPADFQHLIFHSSPMHDVGKIGIADQVLLKPGGFTSDEWTVMKTHCTLGASILSSGTSPYTLMGAEIALNHHERWDGSGYPSGLIGEAIPLAARIMQICDVYDALRSKRPYKQPIGHAHSVEIITQGDGRVQPEHFDPAVLACFVTKADEFRVIYDQHCQCLTKEKPG